MGKLFILFTLLVSENVVSQISENVINSSGGQTSNTTIHLVYSIGEPFIYEYKDNLYVTEGLIQPFTKSITSTNNLIQKIDLFPNPTLTELFVLADNLNDYIIQILDLHGRVYPAIITENNSIDTSNLGAGIYLVRVYNNISKIIFQEKFIKI